MAERRIGVWMVGARGGVATTVAVGLAALARGEAPTHGLLTASPEFDPLGLPGWGGMVLGGHDVRGGLVADAARDLERQQGALPPGSSDRYAGELAAYDARVRPGVLYQSGPAIEAMADAEHLQVVATPHEAIKLIATDLNEFRQRERLDGVVVVLLGSTEPAVDPERLPDAWGDLEALLDDPEGCPLRASSLYAIAAIRCGMPVVNFTPSLGSDGTAIDELARREGVAHAGRDGKTGETLLKSVLAPMFAARRLRVESWVSHNLLGNRDGEVLADPANKSTKLRSKEDLLERLLGYSPQSHVSIESIGSLGDWKTAWDHVHFRGFLGVPMALQFTWQGCDSALAAPLVIDLVRLIDLAARRGESGAIAPLACFFKSPMGCAPDDLAGQMVRLLEWLESGAEAS